MKKIFIPLSVILFFAITMASPSHAYFKKQDTKGAKNAVVVRRIIFEVRVRAPIASYEVEVIAFYQNSHYFRIFSCPAKWIDMEKYVDISGIKTEDELKILMQLFIDNVVCGKDSDISYFIIKEVKKSD